MIKDMERLSGHIAQLLAVETLEYEDKNWLAGDNCSRSKMRQELLREIQDNLIPMINITIANLTGIR